MKHGPFGNRMRVRSLYITLSALLTMALVASFLAFSLTGCGGELPSGSTAPATSAQGPTTSAQMGPVSLNGAGATFPQPLYLEWIGAFTSKNKGIKINYQGIGSGGGIQQFTQMTVDFGASDAPMKDEEIAAAEQASGSTVLHIPTVFGAVVLAYNLPGVSELKLDQAVLAAIFLGKITKWNDPALAALNPNVTLPDMAIQPVHRSDASGTTSIFTGYLAKVNKDWKESVGAGKDVKWPVGIGAQGNDGVAAVVQQQPGSIGYVELSYALETGLPTAALQNKSGAFIAPTLESTSAAAVGIEIPDDLRFSASDSASKEAYPIVGATWILAYEKMKDAAKAEALKAFLTWALNEGGAIAEELHYAPLPEELKVKALAKIESIH